ncbi:scarecrow-like protein 14 [Phragmites australis]|uniref:scarecrow-like protein 14 n=1 Tax=Phragmites australis TaxID=29695 RepID=UPI002D7669E1|nr:scarecrow-like protein 14 [Phragmites australis]
MPALHIAPAGCPRPRRIKQHATPQGDATQRLAHCFAEDLQARFAGTVSMVYQSLMAKRTSAVAFLQAYLLCMAAICCKKVVFIFSNHTIYNASLGSKTDLPIGQIQLFVRLQHAPTSIPVDPKGLQLLVEYLNEAYGNFPIYFQEVLQPAMAASTTLTGPIT